LKKQNKDPRFKILDPSYVFIFIILILFLVGISDFGSRISFAEQKEYDGLWFMGFNLHKDIFGDANGNTVRKAFNHTVNRAYLATKIINDPQTPTGVIPYGMLGYDKNLKGYSLDTKYAKELMGAAGYPMKDSRIKNLSMLHTDGKKTIEIAKAIERSLRRIGVKITRTEISYQNQEEWSSALASGHFHLFLMGYKATPISEEIKEDTNDPFMLLQPLFHSAGSANFTYFRNARVDLLLDQIASDQYMGQEEKIKRYKEINQIIQSNPPTINLFYITKL